MTPDDVIDVLALAASYDQRTVGTTDVAAWHLILHRFDRDDALAAVVRHHTETRERLMPADIVRLSRLIREERARLEKRAAPLALPSRYEDDPERDARNRENATKLRRQVIAPIVARMTMPQPDQWIPNKGAPKGAWWEDEAKREAHANELLYDLGRLEIKKEEG